MLPDEVYKVMKKYSETRIIDDKDRSNLEFLVGWKFCIFNGTYAKLTQKGLSHLKDEERMRGPMNKFFRTIREIFYK